MISAIGWGGEGSCSRSGGRRFLCVGKVERLEVALADKSFYAECRPGYFVAIDQIVVPRFYLQDKPCSGNAYGSNF